MGLNPLHSDKRTPVRNILQIDFTGVTGQRRGRSGSYRHVQITSAVLVHFFFLWRFFLSRFLRLCVAILWRFLFFPEGMVLVI
jgi:hypothetical protein